MASIVGHLQDRLHVRALQRALDHAWSRPAAPAPVGGEQPAAGAAKRLLVGEAIRRRSARSARCRPETVPSPAIVIARSSAARTMAVAAIVEHARALGGPPAGRRVELEAAGPAVACRPASRRPGSRARRSRGRAGCRSVGDRPRRQVARKGHVLHEGDRWRPRRCERLLEQRVLGAVAGGRGIGEIVRDRSPCGAPARPGGSGRDSSSCRIRHSFAIA